MYTIINDNKGRINQHNNIYDYYVLEDQYTDSILNTFLLSLNQFDIPLIVDSGGKNILTYEFLKNRKLRFKEIPKDQLYTIASEFPNQNILLPIINIENKLGRSPYSKITLSVFILRDKSILYYKSMKITVSHPINNKLYVDKERWDGLVHVCFWEYLEQIGLGKKYNKKIWKKD